ncbi:hypothetical protein NX059_009624 [Plenodomus lindquistii]|nr:hypothetical protein NX059_009624 [Plenodomus lindquistii]
MAYRARSPPSLGLLNHGLRRVGDTPKDERFVPEFPGAEPTSQEDFYDSIRTRNAPCSCPSCWGDYKCTRAHSHRRIQVPESGEMRPLVGSRYEAMHLVDAAVQFFTRKEKDMSEEQMWSVSVFRDLFHQEPELWDALDKVPGKDHVNKVTMGSLLDLFNQIFFFGALDVRFRWQEMKDPSALGFYSPVTRCINMSPTAVHADWRCGDVRGLRWDILLHECVHALLDQYACQDCESFDVNVLNAGGHGRAFQVMCGAVFEAAGRLLGIADIPPSFSASFLIHWNEVRRISDAREIVSCRSPSRLVWLRGSLGESDTSP